MPYGITQCCLPPGRGENPAFTQAEAGKSVYELLIRRSDMAQAIKQFYQPPTHLSTSGMIRTYACTSQLQRITADKAF